MQHHHASLEITVAAKHRVSVNLATEEYQELSVMSEKYLVSMAWLSRQAIRDFLERYRDEDLQLPLVPTSEEQGPRS